MWEALRALFCGERNNFSPSKFEMIVGYDRSDFSRIKNNTDEVVGIDKLTVYCVALGMEYSVAEKLMHKAGIFMDGDNEMHAPLQIAIERYSKMFYDDLKSKKGIGFSSRELVVAVCNKYCTRTLKI